MATPRTVFIDFDGTYAEHGVVPSAHVEAVTQARRNGHRVFLCTGRPKSMVPAHVLAGVFDGLVSAAGGYVELDGQVLADVRFPTALGAELIRLLDDDGALYVLEAPEAIYGRPGTEDRLAALLGQTVKSLEGPRDILAALITLDDLTTRPFSKITCFSSGSPLRLVADTLADRVALLPSSLPDLGHGAGEFYLPSIDKSVGIAVVTDHLGVAQQDVIAIGDGHNDIEMLEHAGIGVAVKGGPQALIAQATLFIDGPAAEGLVAGFNELGLT